jgi:hypothetical protein
MNKDVQVVVVTYEQYTEYDFIDPATFFVVDAMQNYVYFKTSKRDKAQQKCDELYGKGKYTVKASKIQKTKSKLESGGVSVRGVGTRKGQRKY